MITYDKNKAFYLFKHIKPIGYEGLYDASYNLCIGNDFYITINYDKDCKGMWSIERNGKTIAWGCGIELSRSEKNTYIPDLELTSEIAINEYNKRFCKRMKPTYYYIDGCEGTYKTLFDVRLSISMLCKNDKKTLEGCYVIGYNEKHEQETCCRIIHIQGSKVIFKKNKKRI